MADLASPQPRLTFGRLLEPLLGPATGYARALLRNRHDAEDAVQQAALRGLERFNTFDPARPFKAWWFSVLRNCCMDLLRDPARRREEGLGATDLADPQEPAAAWADLAAALDRLGPDHREILRLRYFGDLNYRELAEVLDVPQGTVMSRLHSARKALAAQFAEGEP
jgi:RNA polymerase sigma-70 factor (ECF subfamily)